MEAAVSVFAMIAQKRQEGTSGRVTSIFINVATGIFLPQRPS